MKTHYTIVILIFFIAKHVLSQNMDSLQFLLKQATHDTTRCNVLVNIIEKEKNDSVRLVYNEQLRKIIATNLQTQKLTSSLKLVYLRSLAKVLQNIALHSNDKGNMEKSLEYHNQSLKIREQINDQNGIAESLNSLALIYLNFGDFKKAFDYYYKSLSIVEKTNNKEGVATLLNNIGKLYQDKADYEKAIEWYEKALKMAEATKNKVGITAVLNNIGVIYKDKKEYKKALDYSFKSLKIAEDIKHDKYTSTILGNIGIIYKEQGNLTEALNYTTKALKKQEAIKYKKGIVYNYFNLSSIYQKQNKHNDALKYAEKSLSLAKELNSTAIIKNASQLLYQIYKEQNNTQKALEMHELYTIMKDSIDKKENYIALTRQQVTYDYEKKITTDSLRNNALAREEKFKHNEAIKQQRIYTSAGIFGFVCMLIVAVIAFVGFKNKQKANTIIQTQNHLIEQQKAEVEQQLLRTQMNPHFIFNAVNTLNTLIFKNKKDEASLYLNHFSNLTRKVLLYSEEKYISLQNELEVLENYIALQKIMHGNIFNHQIMVDEIVKKQNVMIPPMLAQPFVENAIKHGINKKNNDGWIHIKFEKKENKLFLTVEDNGSGLLEKNNNNHKSKSIEIIKRRLAIYYKKTDYEIIVENKLDDSKNSIGAIIYFEVPFVPNNKTDLDND